MKPATLVVALVSLGIAQTAAAQDAAGFPSRPVRIVAPSSVGGGIDVMARLVSPKLTEAWGKQVIVDNRSGASGIIGYDIVAKAPPDGHTILLSAGGYTLNPLLFEKLPYDTMNDFARVSLLGCAPNVLVVHASVPVGSVKELLALAKAKPKQLAYGSAGSGTTSSLSAMLLLHMSGVDMVHVPYKGAGDLANAVVAGEVQVSFSNPNAAITYSKAGRLRALGVTSARRLPLIPDVPTVAESGLPGFEVNNCFGVLAPAKTPRAIVGKMNAELRRIVQLPDTRQRMVNLGYDIVGSTPEEFTAFVREDMAKWAKVFKAAGIQPQ